jgi:DNA-binding response OmpR family regulator
MLSVLFRTSRDAVKDRLLGLDAGAEDYLMKPFSFAALLERGFAQFERFR